MAITPLFNSFHWFAGVCLCCGLPSQRPRDLCLGCEQALERPHHQCQHCAIPLPLDGICGQCQQRPPPFSRAIIPYLYQSPVSDLILQLKHGAQLQAARLLGELLSQAVMEVLTPDSAPDLLIPVPLHWQRRWQRGFNQSLELASTLSHATAIPVADDRVKRIKRTPSQRGLTRTQRLQNLRGAFFCTKPVDDLRIAIIDDVMTTGSTVTRLAETLISSGARQVEVWCAARTVLEK